MSNGERCQKCNHAMYQRSALLLGFHNFSYCEVCHRKFLLCHSGQLCPDKCLLTEGCVNPNCDSYYLKNREKSGKIIPHWPMGLVEKTT